MSQHKSDDKSRDGNSPGQPCVIMTGIASSFLLNRAIKCTVC